MNMLPLEFRNFILRGVEEALCEKSWKSLCCCLEHRHVEGPRALDPWRNGTPTRIYEGMRFKEKWQSPPEVHVWMVVVVTESLHHSFLLLQPRLANLVSLIQLYTIKS